MTPDEISQWKINYQQNSFYYRGLLIDRFSTLENEIELYITVFFFGDPNKEFDFKNIILERMTFDNKLTAFKSAFEKSGIKNDKLFKELTTLKNIRNRFAHNMFIVPWKPNQSLITYATRRDSNNIISHSKTEYYSLIDRIQKASDQLTDMWRDLLKTKWNYSS